MPEGVVWLYIVGMGIFATLAQYYMTREYGVSKAGIVGAVSYSSIVFSVILGLMLGDALPDVLTSCGIVLIIIAGIMAAKGK